MIAVMKQETSRVKVKLVLVQYNQQRKSADRITVVNEQRRRGERKTSRGGIHLKVQSVLVKPDGQIVGRRAQSCIDRDNDNVITDAIIVIITTPELTFVHQSRLTPLECIP